MNLIQNYLSLGKRARSGINFPFSRFSTDRKLERIIIHWIGPFAHHTPAGVRNWWENGNDGSGVAASAHFIVKDYIALQCLPLEEKGRHSGDIRNDFSIGIEVIPMNAAGEFSQISLLTLKELVQYIRNETKLNLELERHFDGVQRKDCPRFYTPVTSLLDGGGRVTNPPGGQGRWDELKEFLNAA